MAGRRQAAFCSHERLVRSLSMEEPRMPDDGKEGRGSAVAFVSSPTTPSLILISLLQLFPECFQPQRRDEAGREEEHAARSATMTAVTIITMSFVECRLSTPQCVGVEDFFSLLVYHICSKK